MGTLKDIYDVIKDVKTLAKKHHDQEMSDKVIMIQESFFDIREEMEQLREENNVLKETIKKMEDTAELESDLELLPSGVYIRKSEKALGKEINYCPACWGNFKKLMPITRTIGNARQCSNCHSVYR